MASMHPADVVVGVLEEPGVHLHLAREHRLELVGHVVPRGDLGVAGGQLGVGRDDPELLLPGEGALALHVPAVGELARVLVGPLLRHVVRGVRRARARSRRRTACRASAPSAGAPSCTARSARSSVRW